jgi:teichuronic acid biosynthesis glycosyltransferase TuaG
MELVSIIMPAYNAAEFIQEAINSVLAQTFSNWELIIINDGSTDLTTEIIEYNLKQDNRIKSYYQQNGKQGKARNLGISHAAGNYISFLDADDIWLPEKLEITLKYFNEQNEDLIFTGAFILRDNQEIKDFANFHKFPVYDSLYSGRDSILFFLQNNRVPMLTVLVKRSALIDVGLFDENILISNAEDYDLMLRLLMNHYVFKSISIPLAIYRWGPSSSTNNDRLATGAVIEMIKKNFMNDHSILLEAKPYIKVWLTNWIVFCLTRNNFKELKSNLICLKQYNFLQKSVFLFYKLIGLKSFKRILLHTLRL